MLVSKCWMLPDTVGGGRMASFIVLVLLGDWFGVVGCYSCLGLLRWLGCVVKCGCGGVDLVGGVVL